MKLTELEARSAGTVQTRAMTRAGTAKRWQTSDIRLKDLMNGLCVVLSTRLRIM